MDEGKLRAMFNDKAADPTTGEPGKNTTTWLAGAPLYGGDVNKLTTTFGKEGNINRLSDALVNTQRFNAHTSPDAVADVVTGISSGQYTYAYDPKPVSDTFGNRYSVAFSRPDGSQGTLLVPEDDMNNMIRIRQQVVKNATPATPPAATAPAIAHARVRAPSSTAGQGAPSVRPGMVTGAPTTARPNAAMDFWHGLTNPPKRTYGPRGAVPPAPQ